MGSVGIGVNAVRGLRFGRRFGTLIGLISGIILFMGCGGSGGGSKSPSIATFSVVSGTVQAATGNAVDSDVNDLNTIPVGNNDFSSAQTITNPVILGGYVNVAGEGPAGNSYGTGDPDDFFQVTLNASDTIRLSLPVLAPIPVADIEVHLYRASDQTLVDSLIGVLRTGSLQVTTADTYFVQVHAVSGATLYKLVIGDADALTASAVGDGLVMSSEFVPGQALVQWAKNVDRDAVARSLSMVGASVSRTDRPQLMRFSGQDRMRRAFRQLNIDDRPLAARAMQRANANDQNRLDTLAVIRALRRRSDVVVAEPNYIRRASAFDPDDELYQLNLQWNLSLINLPQAWDLTQGDSNVIVAVIDTGVLLNHPDLKNKLVPGWDFITDVSSANDGDGRDEDPDDPGDGLANNSTFHGTYVAGLIGAEFNNVTGIASVGGATRIMPVRALGVDGGVDADLIAAIYFAAGLNDQVTSGSVTVPSQRADIINLSLGGPQHSDALDKAVKDARDSGVMIVAAAGNTATSQPQYPAASPGAISVAAVDAAGQRAYYTSYGATVDVAAPGGDPGVDLNHDSYGDSVWSTAGTDATGTIQLTYGSASGTSFASPHMSGVLALMKAVRSGLTPDEVDAYLAGGLITTDIGDSGLGAGLLDGEMAVQAALVPAAPTALCITPNAIRFDNATSSTTLTLTKLGSSALTVNTYTADASWLSVAAQTIDGAGLGTYAVNVDRTNLSGGLHTAAVTIVSTINTVVVPVQVEVLPDATADAGPQYVVLINQTFTQLIAKQPAVSQNGAYVFSLDNISPGTYYLVAGTDLNNNGQVGEPGEAWGIYPSPSDPATITVSNNISGLNFSTGFSWSLFADTVPNPTAN